MRKNSRLIGGLLCGLLGACAVPWSVRLDSAVNVVVPDKEF
jgi:hypothetical protein